MTDKKNYPEEIYPKLGFRTDGFGRLTYRTTFNSDFERAYDLGYRDGRFKERLEASNPLAGWSNLTAAIKAGERIDWERLDGVEAKCVHPELGALTHRMERDSAYPPDEYVGWDEEASFAVWSEAFYSAWYGRNGWSLWVKGDLPLRKLTADQLEPGTGFRARYQKGAGTYTYAWAQVVQVLGETHVAYFNSSFSHVTVCHTPSDVEVLEVYGPGTFQTPKENQK